MNAHNLESLVKELNAGESIAEVEPGDVRSAAAFFAELRSHPNHDQIVSTSTSEKGYSFMINGLAKRCSPGANVLAVAIRGIVLEAMAEDYSRDSALHSRIDENELVESVARLPLVAADLRDPDEIRRRVFRLDASS
ncbi:MAG: hypothetical protein GEV06_25910 [Luteitalea sp.]|nr:hypothetical protein [Luteitalea sp.]